MDVVPVAPGRTEAHQPTTASAASETTIPSGFPAWGSTTACWTNVTPTNGLDEGQYACPTVPRIDALVTMPAGLTPGAGASTCCQNGIPNSDC